MEIHPSVVLLEPVLRNLIDTDQMIIFRYVENLMPHLQQLCHFASNYRNLTESTALFLHKYIHVYTPIFKNVKI